MYILTAVVFLGGCVFALYENHVSPGMKATLSVALGQADKANCANDGKDCEAALSEDVPALRSQSSTIKDHALLRRYVAAVSVIAALDSDEKKAAQSLAQYSGTHKISWADSPEGKARAEAMNKELIEGRKNLNDLRTAIGLQPLPLIKGEPGYK
jgi:hypothetical protein